MYWASCRIEVSSQTLVLGSARRHCEVAETEYGIPLRRIPATFETTQIRTFPSSGLICMAVDKFKRLRRIRGD
jgi:hypothetical protein